MLHLDYTDYRARFPEIWALLSKEAVGRGAVAALLADNDNTALRRAVDRAFLADLEAWRLDLGRSLAVANQGDDIGQLNEAVTHILNQIVFARILEDRDIEPTGRLRDVVETWRGTAGRGKALWGRLSGVPAFCNSLQRRDLPARRGQGLSRARPGAGADHHRALPAPFTICLRCNPG